MASLLAAPTKNAIQKELSAELLSSASTSDPITLDDVDGIPNLPGVCVINRVDANGEATPSKREYIEYSGTSGSTVIITTRNVDSSNSALTHAVGSIVEFVPDVTWADRIYDSLAAVIDVSDNTTVNTTNVVTPSATQTLTGKSIVLGGSNYISSSGATVSAILDEDDMTSDSSSSLATQQSIKAYVDSQSGAGDGWTVYSAVVPTRASADDPTYVLTFSGVDLTSTIYKGMRVKLTQDSTVRYFIVTDISFSTDTTLTLYGGTDYDVADTASFTISDFNYSTAKAPAGFPLNPDSWTVESTSGSLLTQSSPSSGTWYNIGTFTIDVPIGLWNFTYDLSLNHDRGSAGANRVFATVSTANNAESDTELSCFAQFDSVQDITMVCHKEKILDLSTKDTYYALGKQTGVATGSNIYFRGDNGQQVMRAICAYL